MAAAARISTDGTRPFWARLAPSLEVMLGGSALAGLAAAGLPLAGMDPRLGAGLALLLPATLLSAALSHRKVRRAAAAATAKAADALSCKAAFMAATGDGILVVNRRGTILEVNEAMETLLGCAAREIVGHGVLGTVVPEEHQDIIDLAFDRSSLVRHGELVVKAVDLTCRRADHSVVAVELSMVAVGPVRSRTFVMRLRDVGTQRSTAEALATTESRFSDFMRATSDWTWETDAEGRVVHLSERFAEVLGLPRERQLGRTFRELAGDLDRAAERWAGLKATMDTRQPFRDHRYRITTGRNQFRHVKLSGVPSFDGQQRFRGYRGTGTDVTEETTAGAKVRYQATHDTLTGLLNRSQLVEELEALLAGRARRSVAILSADVDQFKVVNDTFGNHAGDAVLRQIAARLRSALRSHDIVARLGGDRFAVLLPGQVDPELIGIVCQRVRAAFEQPFHIGATTVNLGLTIGIARAPANCTQADRLVNLADTALKVQKRLGRGGTLFYDPAMAAAIEADRALERDLGRALEQGELRVHYQPQISLATGRIVGVEALTRWSLPSGTPISPGEFIPAAERAGLIGPLNRFVLGEACKRAAAWPELTLAVNISAVQLREANMVDEVEAILTQNGFPPGRLELEITEDAFLADDRTTRDNLAALKRLGVQLAMDDFGTGYSGLSYLRRFPFDKLKIDRSFMCGIEHPGAAATIVESTVRLARDLGLATLAEGVETREQAARLASCGCDVAQGFLFAKAVPADVLETLLDRDFMPLIDGKAAAAPEPAAASPPKAETSTPATRTAAPRSRAGSPARGATRHASTRTPPQLVPLAAGPKRKPPSPSRSLTAAPGDRVAAPTSIGSTQPARSKARSSATASLRGAGPATAGA